MLSKAKIVAFVATTDAERAKPFYEKTLGLKLVSEDPFAVVFDANGTMLRVTKVQEHTPPMFTVLGWGVSNIRGEIEELTRKGVRFEKFPGIPQDELGVWNSPSGAKVAWFKDPDGNTLSLTEN